MAVTTDRAGHEHDGFDAVLGELTLGLERSDRISHQALGGVLEELAIAAPEGRLRSDLLGRIGPGDGTTYSAGTLSKALSVLEKHKLISKRASYAGPNGGRPPERYMLGSQRWAMLGIHVSLENDRPRALTCTLRDLSGQLITSDTPDLSDDALNWSGIAVEIAVCANKLIKTWKDAAFDRRILGVGVEVPGHVHHGEVLQADHAGYRLPSKHAGSNARGAGTPLARQIREQLDDDLSVVLDNDVNLIALRETYRADVHSRPRDGAVIAVFDEGVGAGLLVNNRVHRGHNGAAGEPGHNPVFTEPGQPRTPPQNQSSKTSKRRIGQFLGFADRCSCGRFNHIDCYATPARLTGELQRPLSDFVTLARNQAYDANGDLTDTGHAFWKGGAALGHTIVSLIHAHNPGWLLLLLPPALADVTLTEGTLGDGTAAGLYRQAIETVIDEQAFSSTARDARRGGRWLEVRALSADPLGGAEKAARNAAIRVLDEFVAHVLKRDRCVQEQPTEPQTVRGPKLSDRQLHKERRVALEKDLRAILKHYDPESLIAGGAPDDEYASEEAELARLVIHATANRDTVRQLWLHMFGADSRLLANDGVLNDLVRELVALQTRWNPTAERPFRAVS